MVEYHWLWCDFLAQEVESMIYLVAYNQMVCWTYGLHRKCHCRTLHVLHRLCVKRWPYTLWVLWSHHNMLYLTSGAHAPPHSFISGERWEHTLFHPLLSEGRGSDFWGRPDDWNTLFTTQRQRNKLEKTNKQNRHPDNTCTMAYSVRLIEMGGCGSGEEPASFYQKAAGLISLVFMSKCPWARFFCGSHCSQCMNVCTDYFKSLWTKAFAKCKCEYLLHTLCHWQFELSSVPCAFLAMATGFQGL